MAFDYKKEYKEFYMPKAKPEIVTVPKMNYIAVRGSGDPNAEDGDYKAAVGLLYAIAFTIKMSKKGDFQWISVIRLPDFVTEEDFKWAVNDATNKKKQDFSKVEFLTIEEGLCVQCMHIGAYDDEPTTVVMMDRYLDENGYENDMSDDRRHHEIYLSDARRVAPEKLKTVIRHPIKAKGD